MGKATLLDGTSSTSRTEAVSLLFLAHHRRLVGLASLLVDDKETAEDVVQEAFASLYAAGASCVTRPPLSHT